MKKTRKISRLLKLNCGGCTSCCTDLFVELTAGDISRLVKHTKISADRFVKLYSGADIESDDDNDWIQFSYGKRIIGLKKKKGRCFFLSENSRCTAYEARPMTCRSFPINAVYDEDDELVDLDIADSVIEKDIICKCSYKTDRPLNQIMEIITQTQKETEAYCRRIKKWNSLPERGGKKEFLQFLGIMTKD
jgi:Fe-S-cluster containining protein